jgi:rod shape-determining protein MreC
LSPFYRAGSSIGNFFDTPENIDELTRVNEELREENTQLKIRVTQLESAEQENESLRQLLDFFEADATDLPRTVARVVGRDPENQAILLLNAGERDGVEVNNAVVVQDGVIVGKIIEVSARTSKALLLTDTNSSVAVTVSGGTPSSKIARGERGLSLILDQIPQGETISQGQLVITSGLEPTVPKGLLVGEIEEIVSETNDLFQRAVLRPIVDYQEVYFVSVILTLN